LRRIPAINRRKKDSTNVATNYDSDQDNDNPSVPTSQHVDVPSDDELDKEFGFDHLEDTDLIVLKVRLGTEQPNKFRLKKSAPLEKIFQALAEKKKVEPTRVKLMFDGESISPEQTPEDLDMEDEDLIDASIK